MRETQQLDAALDAVLPLLASKVNGTPAFDSTEEGYNIQIEVDVCENLRRPDSDLTLRREEELREQYPNGFHILRVHAVQPSKHMDNMKGAITRLYIQMEILVKSEGELSVAEAKEEADLKNRIRAEKELEAESLVLDSLENGIVDLIRASDDLIVAYSEMSDAKKKVIRSHLNTLQALMRL